MIVATGTEYPALSTRGVREFTGRGVYFGVPTTLPANLRGREVFVTGEPGAAAELRRRLRARPHIVETTHTEIVEVVGVERVEAIILRDLRSGRTSVRNAAALFVLGIDRPRTAWLAGTLALDARGYVLTGKALRESGADGCSARHPFGLEASRPGVCAAQQALQYLRGVTDPGPEQV